MPSEAGEGEYGECKVNKAEKLTELSLETCITVYNSIGHIRRERLNFKVLFFYVPSVLCRAVMGGGKKHK